MEKPVRINKRCLVRNQECKRIFEGSRICFIASPANDEVALELEVIQQKLRSENIEPYIAVEQRELHKDIFCEKICSKIIESNFCIVILNDVKDKIDNVRKPNANVYYEYGLMTAFGKKIIPIQLDGHKLAFNIQSLDTVKYDNSNFSKQIEEAIKFTLLTEVEDDITGTEGSHIIEWVTDILGLVKIDTMMASRFIRPLNTRSLGFSLFNHREDGRLFFVGTFRNDAPDDDAIFYSKLMTMRVGNYLDDLRRQAREYEKDIKSGSRSPSFVEQRLVDLNRFIDSLDRSKLLILKENIKDVEALSEAYSDACSDLKYKMDIKIVNAEQARELFGR